MKRRHNLGYMLLGVLLAIAVPLAAATADFDFNMVNIVVNGARVAAVGENLPGTEAPYSILYDGTAYMPVRQLAELLEFDIQWNEATRTVSLGSANVEEIQVPLSPGQNPADAPEDATLQVIFFDVGQADCILVKTANHAMLIDAGNTGQDRLILGYLSEHEIYDLDYLVATHPHADHIGAMTSVVKAMDSIGEVIMPDVIHTTKTYENLLIAIEAKDIALTTAKPGDVFALGTAKVQVLAPVSTELSDLNECSLVLRVVFGDVVFLFTGDAGTKSETAQLAGGLTLSADVLKVGHHGSRTSSSQRYLDAVAPHYAVLSCGIGNSYGHPHSEAMTRLARTGAIIYRTDENGTILFETDGEVIYVSVECEPESEPEPEQITLVFIGNKNSRIFHSLSCRSLPQESNAVPLYSRQEALDAGFSPCGTCKP